MSKHKYSPTVVSARVSMIMEIARRMAQPKPGDSQWALLSAVEEIRINGEGYYPQRTDNNGKELPVDYLIAIGNWNAVDKKNKVRKVVSILPERICAVFQKLGVEIEWNDMVCECSDCNRVLETEPTGYWWTPEYVLDEGVIRCKECHADEYPPECDMEPGHETMD